MDHAHVRQSHKHPNLCTVTVDGYKTEQNRHAASLVQAEHHWRLPNTDPRSDGKYLFRLHTLDIYFWKPEDAHAFVAAAKSKMHPDQIEILDAPPTPAAHEQAMSPVVQQLESVAIQDPAYRNGQTRNSRTTSTSAATSGESVPGSAQAQETPKAHDPAAFKPLAYNPAAPAAPEPIKHREKTPPPVDAEEGTGLAGAAYRDHSQMASHSSLSRPPYSQVSSAQGYVSPQPSLPSAPSYNPPSSSTGYVNSMSPAPGQRTSGVSSFPPPPPQSGQGSTASYSTTPSFAPPPQGNPSRSSTKPNTPSFSAPPQDQAPFYRKDTNQPESPASEILGNTYVGGVRQPLQHLQPQYANYTPSPPTQDQAAPIGGYSNYQYDQQQPQQHRHHHHHQQPQDNDYDIHSQVYRPTPEEASKYKPPKASKPTPASGPGRLEQGAGKVDKKVNSFFKKLEKKVG